MERARLVAEGRKRDKELKAQRLAEERRLEKEKKEAALKLQREQEEQERLLKKKEKEEKLKLAKKERKERKAREKQEQEEREAREAAAAAEAARQKQEQDELRRQRLESERQAFYQRQQQEQLQRVAAQVAVHQGGLEGLTGSTAVPSRNSSVEYSHTHADSSIPSSPRDFVKPLPHQSHSSDYLPSLRAQQMPVSQQSAYPMPNGMLQSTILQHRQHSRQAHLRQLSQPAQPLRGAPDVFSTASSSLLESILVPNAPNQGMSSMQASSQRPQSTGASETSSPLLNPPGLLAPQGAPMSTSYRSSNSNEMLANPSAPLSGLAGIGGPSLLSAHSLIGQNSQSSLMSELPSQSSLLGGLGQTPASSSLRPAPIQRPLRVAEPSHSKDIGLPHLLNDEVTLRLSGLYDESDEVIVDSKPGNPLLSDLNHQRSWNSVLDPSPMSHSPTGVPDGLSSRPILSNANSIGGSHSLGFEGRLWSKPSQVPASNPPVQLNQHQPPQVMTHQQFMQMQSAGGSFSGVATGNATKGLNGQNTGFSPLGMSYGTDAGLSAQSLSQQGQTQDQQQPQSNPLAPSSSASTWTSSRFF